MGMVWRVLWFLAGIAEIIFGIYCVVNPGLAVISIALWLGIAILIHGISSIIHYCSSMQGQLGATWYLVDGILSTILGIFMLFTQASVVLAAVLPLFFAIFLICKGIFAAISSVDIKHLGGSRWGLVFIVGLLVLILGILSFIQPVVGAFTIGLLLGLFLIFMGVLTLCQWYVVGRITHLWDQLPK